MYVSMYVCKYVCTLTIFENATVYIMAGFHEIHMTTIHIQLPKLLPDLRFCYGKLFAVAFKIPRM